MQHWFEFQITSNFVGVLDVMGERDLWDDLRGRGGLGTLSVSILWAAGVYLVRHRGDIWNLFHRKLSEDRNRNRAFYIRWPRHLQRMVKASWWEFI